MTAKEPFYRLRLLDITHLALWASWLAFHDPSSLLAGIELRYFKDRFGDFDDDAEDED
jgi:hypothetical protein